MLSVEGISKNFGPYKAVQEVSFKLERGEVVGFLGPNGAGKTTTMRMIAGLIHPTQGVIHRTGRLSAMIEEPSFYPYLSGYENMRYIARIAGISQHEITPALERVGLLDRQHQRVLGYSQGMRQRLGLARALLGRPEILLLDEPTNGLDPQGVAEMREIIRNIADEGITVLLSSHILAEVEKIAPRVLIIHKGELKADGLVREMFDKLGAEQVSMSIETPQGAQAVDILAGQTWIHEARLHASGTVIVRLAHEQLAQVAPLLIEHQIDLLGLRPDIESLEQIYLRTIGVQS